MNFVEGRLIKGGKDWAVLAGDTALPVPARFAAPRERKVTWGVRPEHLTVVASNAGIPSRAEVVEPTGAVTYVSARIAGQPVTAVLRDRRTISPGELIGLFPEPDRIHLFDIETGARIGTHSLH